MSRNHFSNASARRVVLYYAVDGLRGIQARVFGQPAHVAECLREQFTRADYSAFSTGALRVITSKGAYNKEQGPEFDRVERINDSRGKLSARKLVYRLTEPEPTAQTSKRISVRLF